MARYARVSGTLVYSFKQASTPTALQGLTVGDIWVDTSSTAAPKVCTSISPVTFTTMGSGGTPGGSDTYVQYNDSSAFGGDSGFTYNKTTHALTASSFIGALTGNVTGNVTGNCTGTSGSTTGNAATVSNGVYTTDTGSVTNTMLAGSIANNKLANSAVANLSGTNTGDQTNISGNAATVTTNANLTGPVTSTGNATAIANGAISNAMLANGAVANLSGTNTGDQVTTKGDLAGYGSSSARVPVGSNYYFLQADSTTANGVSYQLPILQDQIGNTSHIDFYGSLNGDGTVNASSAGTGASCAAVVSTDTSHLGILKMDMGTTTTGYAYVQSSPLYSSLLGNSTITLETCVYMNTLSNGTDTYTFYFGQSDSAAVVLPSNGVWIGYNSGVNSGNWTVNVRKAGSITTTNGSSGPSATTWYKLRLVITNTTSISAYVGVAGSDFSLIGTVTAACPVVNMNMFYAIFLKSAGTTDTYGYLDYLSSKVVYPSTR